MIGKQKRGLMTQHLLYPFKRIATNIIQSGML